jgi:phosphoglycerate dehydrogenase-like enzyme
MHAVAAHEDRNVGLARAVRAHSSEVQPEVLSGEFLQPVVGIGHVGHHVAMTAARAPRVALMPEGVRPWIADAIRAGGGDVVGRSELSTADVLVWADPLHVGDLDDLLGGDGAGIQWVQLPYAGVEPFAGVIAGHDQLVWTCAKGVYAEPVAEHALMLLLAGLRGLGTYGRASTWLPPQGTNLLGAKIVILGGGGITESLLRLLAPFHADVTVVRRHPDPAAPMVGASRVVDVSDLDDALTAAVGVVLALALTPETHGIMGRDQLARLGPNSWIVNVARGGHIVTADLVEALQSGRIGGAALDVTDPEPLPEGHPLWSMPNCIITPHVGNTPEMAVPLLAARITENLRRWRAGEPLLGPVDPTLGY